MTTFSIAFYQSNLSTAPLVSSMHLLLYTHQCNTSIIIVQFLWNSFYRKRLPQQNGDMRKRDLHAFKLHLEQGRLLSPPPPRPPSPPTRDKRLAGSVFPVSPPPPPTHSPWLKYVIFRVFGQKRGRPLFRGSIVLQLNSDSFCDYVRVSKSLGAYICGRIHFL